LALRCSSIVLRAARGGPSRSISPFVSEAVLIAARSRPCRSARRLAHIAEAGELALPLLRLAVQLAAGVVILLVEAAELVDVDLQLHQPAQLLQLLGRLQPVKAIGSNATDE
jgi:hypothetical protein